MTHDQIKQALADKGYSLAAAAKTMDRSYLQLYTTTTRKAKSRYVATALAILLDKPVLDVFPEYPEYGEVKVNTAQEVIDKGREKLIDAGLMSA